MDEDNWANLFVGDTPENWEKRVVLTVPKSAAPNPFKKPKPKQKGPAARRR
jgi:hypothetical protein